MKYFLAIASVLAVLGLTSCEKGLVDGVIDTGSEQVTNSLLQVRTRTSGSGSDATISYPLQVYVFQGDDCRATQTIDDEEQTLNIALTEGTYSVYAVGGASTEDYIVPSEDDATTTTAIALREGHSLSELMVASATATLVDGGTNTVTLGLQRKTMLIQGVEIKKVPTAATAVSVTIAPLWQSLTVSGSFSTAGASRTIALTKQEDNRTWLSTSDVHLLPPSSQPASVSVNITIDGATKTYTYSTSDQLEAGYKINIDGTYTEAVGVTLTGTVTGAEWLGERTISFDFDENGSSATENTENTEGTENNPSNSGNDNPSTGNNNPSNFPAAGDNHQDCYVLASTVAGDGLSAELTLLSPKEQKSAGNAVTLEDLQSLASTLGADNISGWRPMTHSEALLLQAAHTALGIANNRYYLFDDSGTIKQMNMENGKSSAPTVSTAYIRLVAVVTVNNE